MPEDLSQVLMSRGADGPGDDRAFGGQRDNKRTSVCGVRSPGDEATVGQGVEDIGDRSRGDPQLGRDLTRTDGVSTGHHSERASLMRGEPPRLESVHQATAHHPGDPKEVVAQAIARFPDDAVATQPQGLVRQRRGRVRRLVGGRHTGMVTSDTVFASL